MSTDPTTTDSTNGGGPVDHHRPEGRAITRRDLLKSGAAAGAAMGMGAIPSQSASATTATSLVATPIVSPGFLAVSAIGSAINGVLGSSPDTSDRLTLHQQATQQMEGWDGHVVQFNNRLEDASTIADIEARDGIATTYENGGTANEGLSTALARVRSFYADAPEHNAIEIANKALLSYRTAQHAGDETDPVFAVSAGWRETATDGLQGQIVFSPDGTDELSKDDPGLTSSTVTLHNDDEHTVGAGVQNADDNALDEPMTPICEVYDDSYYADGASKIGEFTLLSDAVLDAYDEDAEQFIFTLDNDEQTEIETTLRFGIPTIQDSDGEQLRESETVYDHYDLVEILDEIESQSDTIVANYDADFVGELYQLMDDGTLDPNDIRGSAGIARFLSGTDDASESRFQLALMQQLGMERSDLSTVASMSVTYDGATDVGRAELNDQTVQVPTDYETEVSYEGQLFTRGIDSVSAGATYAVDPLFFTNDGTDVIAYGQVSLEEKWVWAESDSEVEGMARPESTPYLYIARRDGNLECLHIPSMSLEWSTSNATGGTGFESMHVAGDNSVITITQGNSVTAFDASNGSALWSDSLDSSTHNAKPSPDGSKVVYGSFNSSSSYVVEADSGAEITTLSQGGEPNAFAWGRGSQVVYIMSAPSCVGVDIETGEETVSFEQDVSGGQPAVSPDGKTLYAAGSEGTDGFYFAFSTEDGSEIWRQSHGNTADYPAYIFADGSQVVVRNDVLDSETGEVVGSLNVGRGGAFNTRETFADGMIPRSYMFDAPSGSDVTLAMGDLTVESITDANGNELDSSDYTDPDYDTYDSQEYAEYVEEHVTYKETIYRESDGPTWNPPCLIGCGDDGGDWIGLAIIGGILLMVVGWVTDLLPFVGDD